MDINALLFTVALVLVAGMGIAAIVDGKSIRGWVLLGTSLLVAFVIVWHRLN
jgi:hypothetical protein